MIELYISKSKYIEWIGDLLAETEFLEDIKYVWAYIPDSAVVDGFEDVQEFLKESNKDNPDYRHTLFMIHVDSKGAEDINIKWVE